MAEQSTGLSDPEGDPDNVLFRWYREYIGEPDEERDVYLGFGLFFGGVTFAAFGLALFVWSGMFPVREAGYFARAGPAYALGMLSIPAVFLGVVVLLPIEKRAKWAAFGGSGIILLSVLAFWSAYPTNWQSEGGADFTIQIVAVYAIGLTLVVGSTAAGLIANYLEQVQPPSFDEVEAKRVEDESDGESWSDAEIRADIESAMENTDINWGGIEKSETKNLSLNVDTEIDTSGMNIDPDTTRMEGVDNQVTGLKQLKGDKENTATSNSTVDDQTAALTELKQQKREGKSPGGSTAPDTSNGSGSIADRLRGLFD
jgi:hypothetical protein